MTKENKKLENYAFVDAQNLHMAKRFRTYLREHYDVKKPICSWGSSLMNKK